MIFTFASFKFLSCLIFRFLIYKVLDYYDEKMIKKSKRQRKKKSKKIFLLPSTFIIIYVCISAKKCVCVIMIICISWKNHVYMDRVCSKDDTVMPQFYFNFFNFAFHLYI